MLRCVWMTLPVVVVVGRYAHSERCAASGMPSGSRFDSDSSMPSGAASGAPLVVGRYDWRGARRTSTAVAV